MARRGLLNDADRNRLFGVLDDDASLIRFYSISDDDRDFILSKRGARNQLGMAVHLSLLRYAGFGLRLEDEVPAALIQFLAQQIGVVARRISRVKFGLYHPDHAVFLEERTESGRPAPSMRFRTATPMAASVR